MTPDAAFQTTVAKRASLSGVGLHTGRTVHLELAPAPVDTGIVFVRTDLKGDPEIPVAHANVRADNLQRRTELANAAGAAIATIEHLLASCIGLGLDNARVQIDGPEVPILDGSAAPFVELIDRAGLLPIEAPRRLWQLRQPVSLVRDDAELHAVPSGRPNFAFFATLSHLGIHNQTAETPLDPASFRERVAPARTWVSFEDVERLRAAGLIRGGSLDCAIVLRDGHPVETDYRLPNELAAHKLLDLIGDLAILGRPVAALITARGSGHALHHAFVSELIKELYE